MAKVSRLAGSTSHILTIAIDDSSSTTGAGLTGLAFGTAGLTCYYKRNTGAASAAVTLATITTLGTYASGGFKEIDATNMPGMYEFHPPDAAYASGAKSVVFLLKGATNMAPVRIEVELTAVDNQAAANYGMTSLDAAISSRMATYAQPAGFLAATFPGTVASPTNITAATGIVLAAATHTGAVIPTVTTVGTLTTYTGNTPQTGDNFARIGANGAGLTALGDTRLANLDALVSSRLATSGYTIPDNADIVAIKVVTDKLATGLQSDGGSGYQFTTLALAHAPTGGGTAQTGDVFALLNPLISAGALTGASLANVPKTGYVLAAAGLDSIVIETGVNARQALSPILAAAGGVVSGAGTGTVVLKGGNVATTRITATTDNAGNRSSVTLALPT